MFVCLLWRAELFDENKVERSPGHQPGIVNNPKSNLLNSKQKYVNVNIDLSN